MSVKTITITEDAYTRLAILKSPGESFSEVVCRITGSTSLLDLAGILSSEEADALEASIKKNRTRMHTRMKRIARALS